MRKSLGTSIRCARRDLKKQQDYQKQRANTLYDQQYRHLNDTDEGIDDTINGETTFNRSEDLLDEAEDEVDNEDESDDDIEDEDKVIDGVMTDEELDEDSENDDKATDNLMIDEELDEDTE